MLSSNDERIAALLGAHEPPCISLYLSTSRSYPGSQQNAIQYRNLVKEAETLLRHRYPGSKIRTLLEPFDALAGDAHLWTHRLDGMAVFGCADRFHVFDLQRAVPPRAIVADSFHVKPLLRLARSTGRYQVLCLTRTRVRLLEGDRDALDEIDPKGVPATVTEALGEAVSVQRKEQGPWGKSPGEPRPAPAQPGGRLVGHPAKGDDSKLDAERFFGVIDRAVYQRHSRPSGLPLVLAALPENQAIFRALSDNPQLLPEGIHHDPEALSAQQLRHKAWAIVEPRVRERLDRILADFDVARSRGLASTDLAEVARAAAGGRVNTLLLDADRHLRGQLDPTTGRVTPADPAHPEGDDMLDDLGEHILRHKGVVYVVASEHMPSTSGVAAIFRY